MQLLNLECKLRTHLHFNVKNKIIYIFDSFKITYIIGICKAGYYESGGVCLECHYSCATCSGSATSCTSCPAQNTHFRLTSTNSCPC
jgi:hypothetical protein